ncbi:MAG: type VI secretion system baseplate subunit TssG, partial [Planctomycetota bacterium]
AVRRLECAYRGRVSRPTSDANAPGIGGSEHPGDDPVRFCQTMSLAFPPGAISDYVPAEDDHPARLFVSFMGLLGSNGPMPLAVSEYVYERLHNHEDRTLASFLDIFNHRMISLFYRAWARSQLAVSRDDPQDRGFDRYVGSLFGMGTASFLGGSEVPDDAKRHYAGLLACPVRNADGLRSIVSDFFGVPAKVVQFVGRWVPAPEYRCRLGARSEAGQLGAAALLGDRAWDCQLKFRIVLGPMGLLDYERLLPDTPGFRRLVDWVGDYVGDELQWDAQIVLRADEVPRVELGRHGRLGMTAWTRSRPSARDAADLVVHGTRIEQLKGEGSREERGT